MKYYAIAALVLSVRAAATACDGTAGSCEAGQSCTGSLEKVSDPGDGGYQFCVDPTEAICASSADGTARWIDPTDEIEYKMTNPAANACVAGTGSADVNTCTSDADCPEGEAKRCAQFEVDDVAKGAKACMAAAKCEADLIFNGMTGKVVCDGALRNTLAFTAVALTAASAL